MKSLNYLLDLEREGIIDGCILVKIGDYYKHDKNPSLATAYYQRAIDLEYTPAFLHEFEMVKWSFTGHSPYNNVIQLLLEAEKKGLGEKDDRIVDKLIGYICLYCNNQSDILHPSLQFKSKAEMIVHYCDVLIQKGSPKGYNWKGVTSTLNGGPFKTDISFNKIAIPIWEEADRVGSADFDTYRQLHKAYRYVCVHLFMYIYVYVFSLLSLCLPHVCRTFITLTCSVCRIFSISLLYATYMYTTRIF